MGDCLRSGRVRRSPVTHASGILISVMLPGKAAETAAAISVRRVLMSVQRSLPSTTIAVLRPTRFCWCRRFRSVVTKTSNPAASAAVNSSPFFKGVPAASPRFVNCVADKSSRDASRGSVVGQHLHQRTDAWASRLRAANSSTASICWRVTGNCSSTSSIVRDRETVLQVFKDDGCRRARALEHPCAAHPTGNALHRRTLGPVECSHSRLLFGPAYGIRHGGGS